MNRTTIHHVSRITLILVSIGGLVLPLSGDINLEFRPSIQTGEVAGTVEVVLYAVSDNPEENQFFSAMDVILAWDPDYLELLDDVPCSGCPTWLYAGFSDDPYGINETFPPQDGDGILTILAPLGAPVAATPEGTPIRILQFNCLALTNETPISFLETAGSPEGRTAVFDGDVPGLDVTGLLGDPVHVEIICQLCPGDLIHNGMVDIADLAQLLAHYGTPSGALPSEGDMDCDGDIRLDDLAALLAEYGTVCD